MVQRMKPLIQMEAARLCKARFLDRYSGQDAPTPSAWRSLDWAHTSSECYLGNIFAWILQLFLTKLSLGREQPGFWAWHSVSHCDPNLWTVFPISWRTHTRVHAHTHIHRTNFVSVSSALMSSPDSSFISLVMLLFVCLFCVKAESSMVIFH